MNQILNIENLKYTILNSFNQFIATIIKSKWCNSIKLKPIFLLFVFVLFGLNIKAEDSDSTRRVNDILQYYGILYYNADFYKVDNENRFLEHNFAFRPFLKDKNILTLDFGVAQSFQPSGNYITPTDFNITYKRNFKSRKYGSNGFQGIGFIVKQIIPTGRNEYYSGFDSWTIEPLIGTQILFWGSKLFLAATTRYNYTYAALPGKQKRQDFLRIEPAFGFENTHFWIDFGADYRYITSKKSQNIFLVFETGYKISDIIGASLRFKPRIYGSEFFQQNALFSIYFQL